MYFDCTRVSFKFILPIRTYLVLYVVVDFQFSTEFLCRIQYRNNSRYVRHLTDGSGTINMVTENTTVLFVTVRYSSTVSIIVWYRSILTIMFL